MTWWCTLSDSFAGKKPKSPRLEKFFQLIVVHHNKERAAREAGYSDAWVRTKMHMNVREYAPYLNFLQTQTTKAIAKNIAVSKQAVLDEAAKIAFANPQDYIRRKKTSTPEDPRYEQIPIDELPRDMAAAIGAWVIDKDGRLGYSLRQKTPQLHLLAKAMGLTSERLIVQHNHAHMHAHMDMSNVPNEVLAEVEKMLTKAGTKVIEHGEGN